ncbi:hypothetical protein [Wielerella bovis]|uniref:hypothetical protein n=1 Tax=Wielerella bovis TaxID=2917790 RepID=UPI0020199FA3|nr:hypothetical protein [Wielerella bovis]MCG7657106.1 hypothetical protein [Wielerella bovis]MCG7659329.1 hypothetical protein [Wielerella bovis]ULJ60771.1 hypothetical protein MIS44_02605 [Wielerella bovis]ULJ64074.1 hypothetical protein MIS33_07850 [Wielerella bovis]ULJ65950.1 hypothetical protein MIS31_06610 [Wielerella bovis]
MMTRFYLIISGVSLMMLVMFSGCFFYGKAQYQRGFDAAQTEFKAELAAKEQAMRQQQTAASVLYEQNKAQQEKEERVQYVEIQKIIEKPVYGRDCFDADGLQQLNRAINGQ